MLNFPMPFASVPCSIWLAQLGEEDTYGNTPIEYADDADIETSCLYAPGMQRPDTSSDAEDGRPYGTQAVVTFYLPKSVDADLRHAIIEVYPTDDTSIYGKQFEVVGEPFSYMRANTPGDYSWCVEGVIVSG